MAKPSTAVKKMQCTYRGLANTLTLPDGAFAL
jgi:hypothetical protein